MIKVPAQLPTGDCKIAFVGEAPSTEEEALGKPFVGPAGRLFNSLLARSGIERSECLITNVFDYKLPGNDVTNICQPRSDATHPVPVDRGSYLPIEEYERQKIRLLRDLNLVAPNVVVALGATATWMMLDVAPFGAMKKLRGTIQQGIHGLKVIPTYHPSYLLRSYSDAPLVMSDLKKAARESAYPEIREVHIDVKIPKWPYQVVNFLDGLGELTAVDIETVKGRIDCIGFADHMEQAMCVPLLDPNTLQPYWKTDYAEAKVYTAIADFLEGPKHKVMQNGSYDTQWIWEKWGVRTNGWFDDTRILHHSLWPELKKDLGTIASLHLTLPSWKMAGAGRKSTKKED